MPLLFANTLCNGQAQMILTIVTIGNFELNLNCFYNTLLVMHALLKLCYHMFTDDVLNKNFDLISVESIEGFPRHCYLGLCL